MIKVAVTYYAEIWPEPGEDLTDDKVVDIVDRVADELDTLGYADATISGSIAERMFNIMLTASGATFGDVAASVDSAVRSAFHAAEVGSPEWNGLENHAHLIARMERRKVEFSDPVLLETA